MSISNLFLPKRSRLSVAIIAAVVFNLSLAGAGSAQEAEEEAEQANESTTQATELDTVIVTGSRI